MSHVDSHVFVLSEGRSIGNQYLCELRDAVVQKDRWRFRMNLERLGEILAYEISRELAYASRKVKTPLGESDMQLPQEYPLLVTILRAGLPFHEGFLHAFDHADSGFIGAWRNEDVANLKVNVDYVSLPEVEGRAVILIDPMLATGQSVLHAFEQLMLKGTPSHVYVASVVAAPEGLRLLKEKISVPFSLWTCAVDEKLNASFYIVPGLGDAGDLSYGVKE